MKKIISISLCLLLIISCGVMAFASDTNDNGYEINDIETFKEALNEAFEDPSIEMYKETLQLTEQQEQLVSMTNPEVIDEFIKQKTEDAVNTLNDIDITMDEGGFYHEEIIDIGDNCWIKIEMGEGPVFMPYGFSGYITEWVPYGNRYYYSAIQQDFGIGLAKASLYTYYNASANGITISYIEPTTGGVNVDVSPVTASIPTKSATTFGQIAKSAHTYKFTTGLPIPLTATFKMNHNIKYLDRDPIENELHLTFSWDFDSIS